MVAKTRANRGGGLPSFGASGRAAAALVLALAWAACSSTTGHVAEPGARGNGAAASSAPGAARPGSKGSKGRAQGGAIDEGPPGRTTLGEPSLATLDVTIEPVGSTTGPGRSVLFVAQAAGSREAWARRWGGPAKAFGPVLRFQDENVLAGFEAPDGERLTIVSSDGERVCLSTFRGESEAPEERGCATAAPFAVVPVGDRFAFIEMEVEPSPAAAAGPAQKAGAASEQASPKKRPATSSQKPAAKQAQTKKARAEKGRSTKSSKPGAGGKTTRGSKARDQGKDTKSSKGSAKERGSAAKGGAASKKRTETAARRPPRKDWVNVRLRWATRAGALDAASVATGLRFERPLDGMALIDARGRADAVDLAWYEMSPKRKTVAPMVRARVAAGSIRADGTFDPASLVPVLEGDLEYGGIAGHHAGRLVPSGAGSMFVGLTGRPGGCEAVRVTPSLALLKPHPSVCSVAPHRLGELEGGAAADAIAALERIFASDPRRAFGQGRNDPGLAAWAGDRAFFVSEGKVLWASREDGAPHEAEPPFPARRSRVAWGAIEPDGEGIALAAGQLYALDARGGVRSAGEAAAISAASAGGSGSAVRGMGAPPPPVTAPDFAGDDRRRAARIGSTWWLARGDVVRVLTAPAVASALRGRAHPDTSAIVGGPTRGMFIEVVGDRLVRTAVDADGVTFGLGGAGTGADAGTNSQGGATLSPVRAGFDAVARAGGGAIVAGVSAQQARKVVAFAIDSDGKLSRVYKTSLRVEAGEILVRLVALPAGGALLTDAARRQAVWLDDDGREIASAPWPAEDSGATCIDGVPSRLHVPSPAPGRLVRVPELAAKGTCVVGDVVWSKDGTLRWFGSSVRGLDSVANAGVLHVATEASPAPSPAAEGDASAPPPQAQTQATKAASPSPAAAHDATEPPCSADMVSIAGRFCIDRFEAMLVDAASGEAFSPDYPTTPNLLERVLAEWSTGRSRTGGAHARAFPMPWLPRWQRGAKLQSVAVSRIGVRPNGYLTGLVAESACAAAGKRLCTLDEFATACRGEDDTLFPYGDTYEDGACNVFRDDHPAAILHGNASIGHLDPRLNRVRAKGKPLLRETGATPRCRSRWGSDAVYDLVGNIDEWVDEEEGAFAGGFYSRSTRAGCDAVITAHPKQYLDYSTGVRCCRDARGAPAGGSDSADGE